MEAEHSEVAGDEGNAPVETPGISDVPAAGTGEEPTIQNVEPQEPETAKELLMGTGMDEELANVLAGQLATKGDFTRARQKDKEEIHELTQAQAKQQQDFQQLVGILQGQQLQAQAQGQAQGPQVAQTPFEEYLAGLGEGEDADAVRTTLREAHEATMAQTRNETQSAMKQMQQQFAPAMQAQAIQQMSGQLDQFCDSNLAAVNGGDAFKEKIWPEVRSLCLQAYAQGHPISPANVHAVLGSPQIQAKRDSLIREQLETKNQQEENKSMLGFNDGPEIKPTEGPQRKTATQLNDIALNIMRANKRNRVPVG